MIAIKDMEMPNCCLKCSTKIDPETRKCNIDGHRFEDTLENITFQRDRDCPLMEINQSEDLMSSSLLLKLTLNELIKSFLSDKNSLWFLFGVWIGFVIIAIFKFLILKE